MAGEGFSGLTSQIFYPLSCGSDTISSRNPPRWRKFAICAMEIKARIANPRQRA